MSDLFSRAERKIDELSGKKFIHLIHIGKTGGSAVQYALKPYYRYRGYVIYPHSHSFKLKDAPEGEAVVFFLRDPITRFISGFYSRLRQGQPRLYSPWIQEEKAAFARYTTPNQLAEALSSPVDSEREFAEFAMRGIKHVRNHYWDWFTDEDYLASRLQDIFFIGFQETLDKDFDILKKKLNLPAKAALPVNDVVAHRTPQNLDKRLSEQAVQNLTEWYGQDFEFIEKCKKLIEDTGLNRVK